MKIISIRKNTLYLFFVVCFLLFNRFTAFSQDKYIKHSVKNGETVATISKKYKVQANEIYTYNPDAVHGIRSSMILLIPVYSPINKKSNLKENNFNTDQHEVLAKETVYGIAKKYTISIDQLYALNPELEKRGLQVGGLINIPKIESDNTDLNIKTNTKEGIKSFANTQKNQLVKEPLPSKEKENFEAENRSFEYIVLPKETLFSIAKKFQIKQSDLQNANPDLQNKSLKVGYKITIPSNIKTVAKELLQPNSQKEIVQSQKELESKLKTNSSSSPILSIQIHEVLPKESLFSIAKKYQISISDLKNANPELENSTLKSGQKINIPRFDTQISSKETAYENLDLKSNSNPEVLPLTDNENRGNQITHLVLPKETKYGIAKKYGITVGELENQNPKIIQKLLVGSTLTINSKQESISLIKDPNELQKHESPTEKPNVVDEVSHNRFFVDDLIAKASSRIGTPYRSGGTTADGFDCSGLICYTFADSDIKLPRSSSEMANYGTVISQENAQKGDLIFFKTRGSSRINHVGMVVEVNEDEVKFIHSASRGGVIISSTKESYYRKNFIQINRVF